jgi:hypothetical protein
MAQREVTGWSAWALFAGVMMILLGMIQALEGLVALFNDDWFAVNSKGLVLSVDYTAWGWAHLILGIVIVAAGAAVLNGRVWGRLIGVILAMISVLANLAFIAAYPAWSIIVIAIDIFVIYALCVHGDELAGE